MALEEYNANATSGKTPEPAGPARRKQPATAAAVVCRAEACRDAGCITISASNSNGVLLSWAIPKGPSLDPGEKRLAVHVEDHPIDYGGFEGVIPKGQYGGGTVLLWDRGTWTPEGPDPEEAYRKGALKFRLDGEKLHGHWALVRMGGKAAKERRENWLLIKERDEVGDAGQRRRAGRRKPAQRRDRAVRWTQIASRPRPGVGLDKGRNPRRPADNHPRKSTAAKAARLAGARKRGDARPHRAATRDPGRGCRPRATSGCTRSNMTAIGCWRASSKGKVRLITRNGLDWTGEISGAGAGAGADCRSRPR